MAQVAGMARSYPARLSASLTSKNSTTVNTENTKKNVIGESLIAP